MIRNPKTELSQQYFQLKQEYRKCFLSTFEQINSEIENFSGEHKSIYLKKRLKDVKNELLEKVLEERNKYKCQGCGVCCKFAVSEYSYDELKQKANSGDKIAAQFISIFLPYKDKKEYVDIYPEYVKLLENENYYVYHCPKITEDNRCCDYENRPQICKDFPDNPIAFLPLSCAFSNWKLKSQLFWLKLVSETEIINFLLDGKNSRF